MRRGRFSVVPAPVVRKFTEWLAKPTVIVSMAVVGVLLMVIPIVVLAVDASIDTRRAVTASPRTKLHSEDSAAKVASVTAVAATSAVPPTSVTKRGTDSKGRVINETDLIAFYANWDDPSVVEPALGEIDVLMPMWYHLDSKGRVTVDDQERQDEVMRMVRASGRDIQVMPILNNYDKSSEKWNAPAVGKMLADSDKREKIAKLVVETMKRDGFDGVNIDFESFTGADKANIVKFMEELYPRAQKEGLTVSMDVIVAGAAYDHARLARNADFLIPMMYDEHWKTSGPGAISSLPWYERTLEKFYRMVPPEKVVVGLGTYTYDWGKRGQRAKSGTFDDAVALSEKYGKPMKVDTTALNSTFTYKQGSVKHSVWVLDAISAFNQMSVSSKRPPRGYAIWRLGAEDPDVWKVFPYRDSLDKTIAESLNAGGRSIEYDESSAMIVGGSTKP